MPRKKSSLFPTAALGACSTTTFTVRFATWPARLGLPQRLRKTWSEATPGVLPLIVANAERGEPTALEGGVGWDRSGQEADTAQHSTAHHSTPQHSTAQHSTPQHSTAQHSTVYHTTSYHGTARTVQHSTQHAQHTQHTQHSHRKQRAVSLPASSLPGEIKSSREGLEHQRFVHCR
jgi:hypothetical protein